MAKPIVPLYEVAYDITMLAVIGYVWLFFLRRWNRYMAELRSFARRAAIFLGFGFIGRVIDLVDNFIEVPYGEIATAILYGVSIAGVIYTTVHYLKFLEVKYVLVSPSPKIANNNSEEKKLVGAYIISGSRVKIVEVINMIKELKVPILVFTRSPEFYKGLDENVKIVWISQATDVGIPPTKLHVIQDYAIRFARESNHAIVVIDCLEYLLIYNEFSSVFKFLVNLKDHLRMLNSALILAVDEKALDKRQYHLLINEFEPL
ncbi:DUF835 domain-containing protein [Pyrococcus yayanosii]|uniref:DUF835 domain-containing protein n=1 Tax=Pyrococcus yayanosii (strain CH1 / JCM 16557) TaxID=529709 RepID=F8AG66_PYRYC|nr:DUF835 domain-containing protein [Pyrococcus yayanosii]AEH23902.1 hypothetical protein PYCH_02000 [Pyrococcus yayanosii CH1]